MLSVTLLEQSERPLFLTELCVITRQLYRRDIAALRLEQTLAQVASERSHGHRPDPMHAAD